MKCGDCHEKRNYLKQASMCKLLKRRAKQKHYVYNNTDCLIERKKRECEELLAERDKGRKKADVVTITNCDHSIGRCASCPMAYRCKAAAKEGD